MDDEQKRQDAIKQEQMARDEQMAKEQMSRDDMMKDEAIKKENMSKEQMLRDDMMKEATERSRQLRIGVMMLTGSGMPWRKKGSGPAFREEDPAENQSNTTSENTKDATASKSCSAASRTGGGSQHAMTDARTSSSQPSASLQPSSSGYES